MSDLTDRLERRTRAYGIWHGDALLMAAAADEILRLQQAEAQVARLRAALWEYGQHLRPWLL